MVGTVIGLNNSTLAGSIGTHTRPEIQKVWQFFNLKFFHTLQLFCTLREIQTLVGVKEAQWYISMSSASNTQTVAVQGSNPDKGQFILTKKE